MQTLIDGFRHFKQHVFPREERLFRELKTKQNPQALFITCADSRIVPDLIMQTRPGDLFVCRTIGNQVPAHGKSAEAGVASAIEYALEALDVRDIIVCGHSDCGAMKAVLHPWKLAALPASKAWLQHAEPARAAAIENFPHASDDVLLRVLTEQNIITQLRNLATHPSVADRLAGGRVTLHGWFYQIHSGEIAVYDRSTGVFRSLDPQPPACKAAPQRSYVSQGDAA
jgi:carbonic anhydrase